VLNDPKRTRDVRERVQKFVDAGEYSFQVARLAEGDDPAFQVVKTVVVNYTANGKHFVASATDPEEIYILPVDASLPQAEVSVDPEGKFQIEAWQPGRYELKTASGRSCNVEVGALPEAMEVSGPWQVSFPAGMGAPGKVVFDKLASWTDRPEAGVKVFSGTAGYTATVSVPPGMLAARKRVYLDLGAVAVMAQVRVNDKDLGVLWKPPFRLDVTDAVKPGDNALEVRVTNLWINRMIGDESLPEDSDRNGNGTLKSWPKWVLEGKPSPTERVTFTTWRLWKKGDPLLESGLLGPVMLRASERMPVE
jgi:hypothetical protein